MSLLPITSQPQQGQVPALPIASQQQTTNQGNVYGASQPSPQFAVNPLQPIPQQTSQGTPLIPLNPIQQPQIPINNLQLGQQGAQQQHPQIGQVPGNLMGKPQQPTQGAAQPAAQTAPPAPAQDNSLMHDKLTSALHDALSDPASNPYVKALSGVTNMQAGIQNVSDAKDNIGDRQPNKQFIGTQGQTDAVKTAFNGGSYMDIASSMLGKSEGKDTQVLSSFFKQSMGENVDPRQTPWCAAYVNSVLQAGGMQGSGSLAARSLLHVGTPIQQQDAQRGDVIVFGRGGASSGLGHVGFIDHISSDGKTAYVLGGNQGRNGTVSIEARPMSSALGIRRPSSQDIQEHVQAGQQVASNQRTNQLQRDQQGNPNKLIPNAWNGTPSNNNITSYTTQQEQQQHLQNARGIREIQQMDGQYQSQNGITAPRQPLQPGLPQGYHPPLDIPQALASAPQYRPAPQQMIKTDGNQMPPLLQSQQNDIV